MDTIRYKFKFFTAITIVVMVASPVCSRSVEAKTDVEARTVLRVLRDAACAAPAARSDLTLQNILAHDNAYECNQFCYVRISASDEDTRKR